MNELPQKKKDVVSLLRILKMKGERESGRRDPAEKDIMCSTLAILVADRGGGVIT